MKENLEKYFYMGIKYLVHISVVLISTLLTINLLMGLSDIPLFKVFWLIMGLAIEGGAIYCYIMAKAYWKAKKIPQFVIYLVAYLGLTCISLVSNTGFSLMSIQSQSKQAEVRTSVSDTALLAIEIAQLEEENKTSVKSREEAMTIKNDMPDNWYTKKDEMTIKIDGYTSDIQDTNTKLNILYRKKQEATSTEEAVVASSSDIFTALGNGWINGNKVMLYLMLFISFMIEVLKAITAGNYNLEEKKEVIEVVEKVAEEPIIPKPENSLRITLDTESMFKYIDCLMDNGREKLKQDQLISKELDMPLAHCKQFRKQLLSMTYDNKPILVSKQGVGTNALFPKQTIKKLIEIDAKFGRK